jgi:GT2 family glycosyltransferase
MDKVSIIITAYCPESKPYLDQCVQSARALSYKNREIIIVGREDYKPQYEGCLTVTPPQKAFWNSTGLNFGVLNAASDSEYYFLINDDVVLTRNCLQPLVDALKMHPQIGQVMPIGNDMQMRYWSPYLAVGASAFNPATLSPYPRGLVFADTLCMYATLIGKRVWQQVGPFDETLKGQDDIDYSLRIRQAGLLNAIELSSLVWHHGGVSAQHTLDLAKREEARAIFNRKWSGVAQV